MGLGDLYRRVKARLAQVNTASLEMTRSLLFKVVLVFSALAALNGAFGCTAGSFDPSGSTAVRAMLALWAGLHLPLYFLERRRPELARFIYLSLSFIVLAIIFDNTIYVASERIGVELAYHGAMILVALLWLPFARFVLFSSLTTAFQVFAACVDLRGAETGMLVGVTLPLFVQWIPGVAASWLLHRHNQQVLDYQEQLVRHNERLEKEVAARAEVIRQQQERLFQSQKMEAVGRLAGGIAHDFNNLMMVVTGYSELALRDLDEDHPVRKDVETIRGAGEKAASLTSQLLAFSRKQVIQPRVVDVNTVVVQMEKMLRRLIGEDVKLTTSLRAGVGKTEADPGQLGQIVMNLAVNARDAMPQGGELTIETANVSVDEDDARRNAEMEPGPYVAVIVSDTGCGMDEETLSHIFEPFFTTKEVGKGTGLGLATSYGIARQHNGFISVESQPGRGATFRVCLPRLAAPPPPPEAVGASTGPTPGTETVLLVEDEEAVRAVTGRMLRSSGYTVLEARDGDEALLVCEKREGPVHLLMTDVVMPGMNGRDLAERISAMHPQMKVLFMSGYSDDVITHHGVLDPGTAFIEKPFGPDDLARTLRKVLDAPRKK